MPRLTAYLERLGQFRELAEAAARGRGRLSAPTFLHPFLTAGLLAEAAWPPRPGVVVTPSEQAAEELARELSLYLPERRVLLLPSRDLWYGSEGEVAPRVVGRRTGKRYTPQKGPKYGLLCVYSSLLITNTLIAFDLTSFESKRSFAM